MTQIQIPYQRTCDCPPNRLNCLTAGEWLKNQVGVWQFNYTKLDIRDKNLHPATFSVALAKRVLELFTHRGELVFDPFVGSGTTLIAAKLLGRNCIGVDLKKEYIALSRCRLSELVSLDPDTLQLPITADARVIHKYIEPGTVKLIFTSPPYANLLNRKRKNKSRRSRKNNQYLKIEQYSQNPKDLGVLEYDQYLTELGNIFESLKELLTPVGHCVINIADMWWDGERVALHAGIINELHRHGYRLRNTIIWDKTNIVNNIGIFGWPKTYITAGVTFEYLLDFQKEKCQ